MFERFCDCSAIVHYTTLHNYRPIFLTSTIPKVPETVSPDQLRSFLEREGLLSDHKYAFLSDCSTDDLLALAQHP